MQKSQTNTQTQIGQLTALVYWEKIVIVDTVKSSVLIFNINRLAWEENPEITNKIYVTIGDSVQNLFESQFNSMIVSSGIIKNDDTYGAYDLTKIEVNYNDSDIVSISARYNKFEKSPNGSVSQNPVLLIYELDQTQIDIFKTLLLSTEVKALYIGVYNESIGN